MGVLLSIENIEQTPSHWTVGQVDITSTHFSSETDTIKSPSAYVSEFSYAYLHHLFKQKELLAYTLATMHNLAVMEQLMSRIREEIEANRM